MSHSFERVLVIGARGQLGTDLMETFADCDPVALPHAELDIENYESVRAAIAALRPTLVFNTAAFHKVESCESEPAKAFAVNALAIDHLAGACASAGAVFAHVSTDYVFDGNAREPYDEFAATNPINAYGISKLAGELLLKRHGERYFIFRTSGLFGRGGVSNKGVTFVERILRAAEKGEPIAVVNDIVFSPSYAPHVARAIREILGTDRYGTYHVTNTGSCTWHALAVEALRARKMTAPVEATRTSPAAGAARRPPYSVLGHGSIARNGFSELPPWEEGVAQYVEARAAVRT